MAVTIFYNNQDLFDGIGPVPLVSRDVENVYINKVSHLIDRISLSGRVKRTDCVGGFSNPYSVSRQLIDRLSINFKRFEIQENSTIVFETNHAIVRSISFGNDKWYDWIPYTIEIDCYRKGVVNTYGVIDPVQEYNVEFLSDNTVQVTVSQSCRGINDTEQGFKNAQDFISNAATFNPTLLDLYWDDVALSQYTFVVISKEESLNRLIAEASSTIVYKGQVGIHAGTYGVIIYTRELNSGENGEITVSISGTEQTSINNEDTLEAIETDIKTKDWHSIANQLYTQVDSSGQLFSHPIQFSLERNVSEKLISFNITFSNQQNNTVYLIDQTTITHDYERSINCIEATVTIKSNNGCYNTRWSNVVNYYNSFDFISYVHDRWAEYGQTSRLSNQEKTRTFAENRFDTSITLGVRFCDNTGEDCGCLQDFVYEMEFSPSLNQHAVSPTFGGEGCYYIEDLRARRRAIFSLRGSAIPSICCNQDKAIFQLKNRANQVANSFFMGSDKILESSQVSTSNPNGRISFDFSWSADQNNIIPSNLL